MKKLILVLLAAMTFNANAALITLTTDKAEYNVGDTINVTVNALDLLPNGVKTFFYGFNSSIAINSSLISYDVNSVQDLGALGDMPELNLSNNAFNFVSLNAIQNINAIFNPFFNGAEAAQTGLDAISLFSFQLMALDVGTVELSLFEAQLSNAFGFPLLGVGNEGVSFNIAEVPAPNSLAIVLLALVGLTLRRLQSKR